MSKKIRVKKPGKPSLYLLPAGLPAGWRVVGEVDTGRGCGAERQARYVASGRAVTVVVRSPEAKEALERLEKLHGGVTAAIEAAVIEADRQEAKALSVSEQMES